MIKCQLLKSYLQKCNTKLQFEHCINATTAIVEVSYRLHKLMLYIRSYDFKSWILSSTTKIIWLQRFAYRNKLHKWCAIARLLNLKLLLFKEKKTKVKHDFFNLSTILNWSRYANRRNFLNYNQIFIVFIWIKRLSNEFGLQYIYTSNENKSK